MIARIACWLLVLSVLPQAAGAAPFLPQVDAQVIETLPQRLDPELTRLAGLRSDLLRNPAEPRAAAALARAYVAAARRNGDPRFLGYAQAVLERWPEGTAPVEILVLRATVQQSLHQFDAALATLELALQVAPLDSQALLTRATVLQVRGEYGAAERDCAQLWRSAGEATAQLCLAGVASVTGRAAAASVLLQRVLASVADDDHVSRVWAHTLLAENAARLGDAVTAERNYQAARQLDATDRYLLASYCDFLLDQRRAQRVIELTDSEWRDDNLLLRRALALQQLHDPRLQPALESLQSRFAIAARRGERTHQREEARMTLALLHQPATALQLAKQNWQVQKEPADLRILRESAAAAGER